MSYVADAVTEECFDVALTELEASEVWSRNTCLHSWFANTWLSEKQVWNNCSLILLVFFDLLLSVALLCSGLIFPGSNAAYSVCYDLTFNYQLRFSFDGN